MTARVTNVSSPRLSLTEIYINPAYTENTENNTMSQGVFPCAPPPYSGKHKTKVVDRCDKL